VTIDGKSTVSGADGAFTISDLLLQAATIETVKVGYDYRANADPVDRRRIRVQSATSSGDPDRAVRGSLSRACAYTGRMTALSGFSPLRAPSAG
jgi:hypothetical protein